MVKPNKPKVLRNLETTLSRVILDGLVWEKRVSQGSGTGLICVPEALVGKFVKFIIIPVDENESLSLQREVAKVNATIRDHNAESTRATNRKKKLEEKITQKAEPVAAPVTPAEGELEDEDAY